MFRPPTLDEVNNELRALETKLEEFNTLIARKQVLLEYKAVLARMSPNGLKASEATQTAPPTTTVLETSAAALKILSGVPQMHIKEILAEARRLGWSGSGDDAKDKNRFFVSMYRQKGIFEKVGNGVWRLKK